MTDPCSISSENNKQEIFQQMSGISDYLLFAGDDQNYHSITNKVEDNGEGVDR